MAEFLGISEASLSCKLNGNRSFNYERIEKLLQATGIPYEKLFQREDQNEKTS